MTVKPWLGSIREPTGFIKPPLNYDKRPEITLELNHVHGYRSKDCRNNLRYRKSGNIVYNAAALGIVMDINSDQQRYFDSHEDEITAIEVHPDGVHVASGEVTAFERKKGSTR